MSTNMTGLDVSQRFWCPCALDESSLSIERLSHVAMIRSEERTLHFGPKQAIKLYIKLTTAFVLIHLH